MVVDRKPLLAIPQRACSIEHNMRIEDTGGAWKKSLDEVVAGNLRLWREHRGMSRDALAEQLSTMTDTEWTRWKIIGLEGAR